MTGELRVNNITDEAGTGSPDFPNGVAASVLTGDVAAARITDALNATGSAPVYACRAWVNFDGTGTVAIRESGNVSSITDNGTGDYTVNFTTAMVDANYSVFYSVDTFRTRSDHGLVTLLAGSVRVKLSYEGGAQNPSVNTVAIFR